ncbi:unnamed protein product [Rhizopus stolonifer]
MRLFLFLFLAINTVCAVDYFDILKKELYESTTGKERHFYVTAEEQVWDYASQTNSNDRVPHALGTKYYKALYHEYTDSTFTKKKSRLKWQGNMGPILRAEVKDTIIVHFWNKANQTLTMHPHGVFYEFESEGAIFKDGYEKSAVQPNQTYTYTWKVLPRAGPGPTDEDSVVWGYHSHVNEGDIYMGLYGAILIYRPGTLSNDEIVSTFFLSDEAESPYFEKTVADIYSNAETHRMMDSKEYTFSIINGLVNSSPPDLLFKKKTIWHLIAWGTFWDTHYVKWEHGDAVVNGRKVDQVRLYPASFYTAVLNFNESGRYKFGYLDNESEGMVMYYNVSLS